MLAVRRNAGWLVLSAACFFIPLNHDLSSACQRIRVMFNVSKHGDLTVIHQRSPLPLHQPTHHNEPEVVPVNV